MKAKNVSVKKTKVAVKKPLDSMSVGAATAPQPASTGLRAAGMKKGGSCKGYAKGGSIDGVAKQGPTRGKVC